MWDHAKKEARRVFEVALMLVSDFALFLLLLFFLWAGNWAIHTAIALPNEQGVFHTLHFVMTVSTWIVLFFFMLYDIIFTRVKAIQEAGGQPAGERG